MGIVHTFLTQEVSDNPRPAILREGTSLEVVKP